MDYYWPRDIIPQSVAWRIIDASGVFNSALSGAVRTVSRPGTRLGCTLTLPTLSGSRRHRMLGLLAALKGRANRIWLPDYATSRLGSFPTADLLANPPASAAWTSSNAELVLSDDSGRMRMARTGTAADRYAYQAVTTITSAAYLFRAGLVAGRGSASFALGLGTTNTGMELIAGSNLTSGQFAHVSAIASGTTTYAAVRDYSSGKSAEGFTLFDSPSLARCALVDGASQTGSGLWVDQLPLSTSGLLLAGDVVAIYTNRWEMKRLTANLNSNSSGDGHLMFEPAMRTAPADNAPVAICSPTARFLLATDDYGFETQPGMLSPITLEFIEDVT